MQLPHGERPNAPGKVLIAQARHASFVRDLQKRFSNQLGFLPGTAIDQYIAARRVLLICDNGEPAGYLLGPSRLASIPSVVPLVQTAICFDAQRRTLGLQLVEAAAARAVTDGRSLLQAWCRADLTANSFWLAAGFVPIAQRRTTNARRQPLILWRRPVTANVGIDALRLPTRAGHRTAKLGACTHLSTADLTHLLQQL